MTAQNGFVDTSGWLKNSAQPQALVAAGWTKIMRCIGGSQPLTPAERAMIEENGVSVIGAYQMYPSAYTPATGTQLGSAALGEAQAGGLRAGDVLPVDLEGNYGEDYQGFLAAWLAAAYGPLTNAGILIKVYPATNAAQVLTTAVMDAFVAQYPGIEFWTPYPNLVAPHGSFPSPSEGWWASQYDADVPIGSGPGYQLYDLNVFGLYEPQPAVAPTSLVTAGSGPTAFGKRVAAVAKQNAPCDSRKVNVPGYTTVTVRPSDRTTAMHAYYYEDSKLSTCGLWACGAAREAGLTDPELTAPYHIGMAVSDLQTVAARHGVLERGTPASPFSLGDVPIIDDGSGLDAHVIVCVGPVVVQSDGSWTCDTSEGGQFSGADCSASMLFTRTFVPKNGRLYCGERFVICTARFSQLEVPDPAAAGSGSSGSSGSSVSSPAAAPAPTSPAASQAALGPAASDIEGPSSGVVEKPATVGSAPVRSLSKWRSALAGLGAVGASAASWAKAHPAVVTAILIAVALIIVFVVVEETEAKPKTPKKG